MNNRDYQNNTFYNFGGVVDSFEEVINFLNDERKSVKIKNTDDKQSIFEYIDEKKKLVLPLLFKSFIDNISDNNMDEYTSSLYNEYIKDKSVKDLLGLIKSIPDIPIEILSKYYVRLYTVESKFCHNLNKDLRLNKTFAIY